MSSRIAMSLEAQASMLVSFLVEAKHSLPLETALEICNSMRVAKEPPTHFLKVALAGRNIEVKYISCLKAVVLMDSFGGHVSRLKPTRVAVQYALSAPVITPKVKRHRKSTDTTADLRNRPTENLVDAKESLYA